MAVEDIVGFGVGSFRSYGSELQILGPMAKVHLLAGRNNVGKSNFLRFVRLLLNSSVGGRYIDTGAGEGPIVEKDRPEGASGPHVMEFALGLTRSAVEGLLGFDDSIVAEAFGPLFDTPAFRLTDGDAVWFRFTISAENNGYRYIIRFSESQAEQGIRSARNEEALHDLALKRRNSASGPLLDYKATLSEDAVWSLVPAFEWIEAKREVGAADSLRPGDTVESGWRNGRGVIQMLANLQSPETHLRKRDRPKFEALQRFVQGVLDDPGAVISIPASQNDLQVETGGRLESYRDLGTGITEVIHIAAVATAHRGYLIGIEEPEVHLHPTLQRQLISFLASQTQNHYLITTHSQSFLDAERSSVTHVGLDEHGWSRTRAISLRSDRAGLVAEIGGRASDVVQSNYLIWVEGPSDRIYVRGWLRQLDEDLIEGAHYSIMFYGGGLLSHLTAQNDPEVDLFIDLAQINRNFAVVIDSDRGPGSVNLNATKERVIDELGSVGGISWVTEGYTIENYLPVEALRDVIASLYPDREYVVPESSSVSPLGGTFKGSSSKPNKVAVAAALTAEQMPVSEWSDHLRDKVSALSAAIRAVNGLDVSPLERS